MGFFYNDMCKAMANLNLYLGLPYTLISVIGPVIFQFAGYVNITNLIETEGYTEVLNPCSNISESLFV